MGTAKDVKGSGAKHRARSYHGDQTLERRAGKPPSELTTVKLGLDEGNRAFGSQASSRRARRKKVKSSSRRPSVFSRERKPDFAVGSLGSSGQGKRTSIRENLRASKRTTGLRWSADSDSSSLSSDFDTPILHDVVLPFTESDSDTNWFALHKNASAHPASSFPDSTTAPGTGPPPHSPLLPPDKVVSFTEHLTGLESSTDQKKGAPGLDKHPRRVSAGIVAETKAAPLGSVIRPTPEQPLHGPAVQGSHTRDIVIAKQVHQQNASVTLQPGTQQRPRPGDGGSAISATMTGMENSANQVEAIDLATTLAQLQLPSKASLTQRRISIDSTLPSAQPMSTGEPVQVPHAGTLLAMPERYSAKPDLYSDQLVDVAHQDQTKRQWLLEKERLTEELFKLQSSIQTKTTELQHCEQTVIRLQQQHEEEQKRAASKPQDQEERATTKFSVIEADTKGMRATDDSLRSTNNETQVLLRKEQTRLQECAEQVEKLQSERKALKEALRLTKENAAANVSAIATFKADIQKTVASLTSLSQETKRKSEETQARHRLAMQDAQRQILESKVELEAAKAYALNLAKEAAQNDADQVASLRQSMSLPDRNQPNAEKNLGIIGSPTASLRASPGLQLVSDVATETVEEEASTESGESTCHAVSFRMMDAGTQTDLRDGVFDVSKATLPSR